MGKNKETNAFTIKIHPLEKGIHAFEKTELYELTNDIQITVPPTYVAYLYFESSHYSPIQIQPCTEKKIVKATRISKDLIGRKFYVIFNNPDIFTQNYPWGAGNIPMRFDTVSFNMGAGGFFEIRMLDVDKYISTLGKNETQAYSVENVNLCVRDIINEQSAPIITQLIRESGTMTVNNTFLMDELNLRLHNYFIESNYFEKYGIAANDIYAIRILTNDISYAPSNPRSTQGSGMRTQMKKPKPPSPQPPRTETADKKTEATSNGKEQTERPDGDTPSKE